MKWTSILAIYLLFWVMAAFFVLPFGVRTHDDDNAEIVPGQVTSAPVNFNPRRIALRATVLSVAMFGVYYLNYVMGWVTIDQLDITRYIG